MLRLNLQYFGGRGAHGTLKNPNGKKAITKTAAQSTPRLPYSTLFKGAASKEEKAQATKIISQFITNAQVGDKYKTGSGVGSAGAEFEIVSYNRSPNKMGIRWVGESRTVAMSRENVRDTIKNGTTLSERKKKR